MSDDKKLVSSIEEQIARITNNFESDVLRLIKTQSMIKSSEEIINDEVKFLKTNIELIGSKLDELSIKTSEINELLQLSSEYKEHSSAHIERHLNEYLNTLTARNNELNTLKNLLEERLSSGSESLKSLQKYYIAELKAFQQEVDSNLDIFKKQLKERIDSQLSNNNHKNETLDLETVEEHSTGNNGSKEAETQDTSAEKIKTPKTEVKHPSDHKYNGEHERLKSEFETYKETFKKQPSRYPHTKKTINADEFYEKMFPSSAVRKDRRKPKDIRKYFVGTILIIWIVAVFGFYMFFLKKDDLNDLKSSKVQNQPFFSENYSNNDYMVSGDGISENTSESGLLYSPGNGVDGYVEASVDKSQPEEKVENQVKIENLLLPESEIKDTNSPKQQEVASQPVYDYTVIVKRANIRKGPGKNFVIVSTLSFGQQLNALNESKGAWVKIKTEDGDIGWIGKRLILKN